MKKLIKKNEFYDGLMKDNEYVEVYVNPTQREINECKKVDGDVRGLIYRNGKCFIWASQYYHEQLKKDLNLDFDQYHFFTEGSNWIRIHNNYETLKEDEVRQALLNCSCLFDIVNHSATLQILSCQLDGNEEDLVDDVDMNICEFLEKQSSNII